MSSINEQVEHTLDTESSSLISPGSMQRGFLPNIDPAICFQRHEQFKILDEIGHDLPSLLHCANFRERAQTFEIHLWDLDSLENEDLSEIRLYYVRVGFLASAYINQVSEQPTVILPKNIAVPLCQVCKLLNRPPILSYDGYALYNWKRFGNHAPISLGNIDTIQNFVHLYDEHWFILVHVEIEAIAAEIIHAINNIYSALHLNTEESINKNMTIISDAMEKSVNILRRIPEKMDPSIYYKAFRPYIRYFENVVYEGVEQTPIDHRGETGAQSTIMPTLVAFMKIPHRPSVLTSHLADMRKYMPQEHRSFLLRIEHLPDLRYRCDPNVYNKILELMAAFREVHYGWAEEYINKWTYDPRGTGGTPYIKWLKQLIDETRAHIR